MSLGVVALAGALAGAQGYGHIVAFVLLDSQHDAQALTCVVVCGVIGTVFLLALTFGVGKPIAPSAEETSLRESLGVVLGLLMYYWWLGVCGPRVLSMWCRRRAGSPCQQGLVAARGVPDADIPVRSDLVSPPRPKQARKLRPSDRLSPCLSRTAAHA
jgi:hypothetical protein